jgi:hypothetical protein
LSKIRPQRQGDAASLVSEDREEYDLGQMPLKHMLKLRAESANLRLG